MERHNHFRRSLSLILDPLDLILDPRLASKIAIPQCNSSRTRNSSGSGTLKGWGAGDVIVMPVQVMTDAQLELRRRQQLPLLRTGNETLDQLLGGGVQPEVTHVFYGAPRVTTRLLQRLAVLAQLPGPDGGLNAGRVVYVDAENNFDPYALSQLAIERHLDPRKALQRIVLARAFSWEQVVELVAEKLAAPGGADGAGLVCIAGLTTMLVPTEARHYQQLLQVIAGFKQLIARQHGRVTVAASTRLHPQSAYRPLGGNVLCHFATVLVRVEDRPKLVEYILERHPSRPPQRLLDFKPSQPRGPAKVRPLDHFFRLPSGESPQS